MFGHSRSRVHRKLHLVEMVPTNLAPPEAAETTTDSDEIAYFIGGNIMIMVDDSFWDHGPEKQVVVESIDPDTQALG